MVPSALHALDLTTQQTSRFILKSWEVRIKAWPRLGEKRVCSDYDCSSSVLELV